MLHSSASSSLSKFSMFSFFIGVTYSCRVYLDKILLPPGQPAGYEYSVHATVKDNSTLLLLIDSLRFVSTDLKTDGENHRWLNRLTLIYEENQFFVTFTEFIEFDVDDRDFAKFIGDQIFSCCNLKDLHYLVSSIIFEQAVHGQKNAQEKLREKREKLTRQSLQVFLDGEKVVLSHENNHSKKIPVILAQLKIGSYFRLLIQDGIFLNGTIKAKFSIGMISINHKAKLHFKPAINTEGWSEEDFFRNLVELVFSKISVELIKSRLA
jgi:hypothetical protein